MGGVAEASGQLGVQLGEGGAGSGGGGWGC